MPRGCLSAWGGEQKPGGDGSRVSRVWLEYVSSIKGTTAPHPPPEQKVVPLGMGRCCVPLPCRAWEQSGQSGSGPQGVSLAWRLLSSVLGHSLWALAAPSNLGSESNGFSLQNPVNTDSPSGSGSLPFPKQLPPP